MTFIATLFRHCNADTRMGGAFDRSLIVAQEGFNVASISVDRLVNNNAGVSRKRTVSSVRFGNGSGRNGPFLPLQREPVFFGYGAFDSAG